MSLQRSVDADDETGFAWRRPMMETYAARLLDAGTDVVVFPAAANLPQGQTRSPIAW
jgi:hypothetical protein